MRISNFEIFFRGALFSTLTKSGAAQIFCKIRCTKDIAIDKISYCCDFVLTGEEKYL